MPDEPQRPVNKPAKDIGGPSGYRPDQLDADLASAAMATEMVKRLGTPAIISKKFIVYSGIWQGLNNSPTNKTGYDTTLRMAIYDKVAALSVNVDGKYFDSFWQFMMKPKYILTGTPMQGQFEEQKPSIFERVANWIRGTKGSNEPK
jgi:hypothetical protein